MFASFSHVILYELKNISQMNDEAALLRWVRTFVVHFTSKRVLERHCVQTMDASIKISLLAVERSRLYLPVSHVSWSEMETIIKDSFPPDSLFFCTASMASETLKNKVIEASRDIASAVQGDPAAARYTSPTLKKIIPPFQSIIQSRNLESQSQPTSLKRYYFGGGMHCETVLETLGEFSADILQEEGNGDLLAICQVLLLTHPPGHQTNTIPHRIEIAFVSHDLSIKTVLPCVLGAF